VGRGRDFRGRQFAAEGTPGAVRWCLMFPISYRDLELMLLDRGVEVDRSPIFRWIHAYAAELEKRLRPPLANEQCLLARGRDLCSGEGPLDLSVSGDRQPAPDDHFLLSAKRFFRSALVQPHPVNPRTMTADKNPAYPKTVTEPNRSAVLWRRFPLPPRQVEHLNDVVEQDPRWVKRLIRPGIGLGSFRTARRTLAGMEAMAMIRKGQIRNIRGNGSRAQSALIAGLFEMAA
jgi:IS6 family transposase